MQVHNDVYPVEPGQRARLQERGPQGPIFMVNLLKFKEKAEYEDGRETALSGREADQIYGRAVSRFLPKFRGSAVFADDVSFLSFGRVEELWDEAAIACYPERAALVRMSSSEEWRAIAVHRTSALKGQLNIETVLMKDATDPDWLDQLAAKVGAGA